MKGPEELIEGVRALVATEWAAKAAEVNATITDGAELETSWGSMAFDPDSLAKAVDYPSLGLITDDGTVDVSGMTGGSYHGIVSFPLELVVVVKSDITDLTGHGLVTGSSDAMRLRMYRYLQALVEIIAESDQGAAIGGYYISGAGRYRFSSVNVTKGNNRGMYAVGSIMLPFGGSES